MLYWCLFVDKAKVVFFAPTNVLALQQVQKIQECLSPEWRDKVWDINGVSLYPSVIVWDMTFQSKQFYL